MRRRRKRTNYLSDPNFVGSDTSHLKIPRLVTPSQPATPDRAISGSRSPWTELDGAQLLDPAQFPNPPRKSGNAIRATIPNIGHMLRSYGITVRYNIIKKKLIISLPGYSGTAENADNVALTQITSLATLNGISPQNLPALVEAVGDRHPWNPVADWITSKPWDRVDRLPDIYATLREQAGYPGELKEILMYRWLLSTVAAALKPTGFRARGVLTLQGPQSIGKTAWVNALVPDALLRESVVKLDHHMDAGNKDSLISAVCHWIVEIGELDSSFRKDIARLKGFLTSDGDKVRRPYAKGDSEYPRKTVFCATVNDPEFLVDTTGNTRWWAIAVDGINYKHNIDMQQLFAQLAEDFDKGDVQWWLTVEEELQLEENNKKYRAVSFIREKVLAALDLDPDGDPDYETMTPIAFLEYINIKNPTNSQCKECAAVFREHFGDSTRVNGANKWRVPVREQPTFTRLEPPKPSRPEKKTYANRK